MGCTYPALSTRLAPGTALQGVTWRHGGRGAVCALVRLVFWCYKTKTKRFANCTNLRHFHFKIADTIDSVAKTAVCGAMSMRHEEPSKQRQGRGGAAHCGWSSRVCRNSDAPYTSSYCTALQRRESGGSDAYVIKTDLRHVDADGLARQPEALKGGIHLSKEESIVD